MGKNFLSQNYQNFLSKNNLNKEKFENILYELLNEQKIVNEVNKSEILLDIDSPLFELILKTKICKIFTIYISYQDISKLNTLEKSYLYFNEIKKYLDLSYNNIDLKLLEDIKLLKLEKLNLGGNSISKINFLETDKFKDLKVLNFYNNKIYDIKVLERVKFEN